MKNEVWKDIKGYEGLYQISDSGKVKSLPKITGSRFRKESIILYANTNRWGYSYVTLCVKNVMKSLTIHNLLAVHFIPNPLNKKYVNHINGNKADNLLENLEWVTAKENVQHAIKIGLAGSIGSTNPNSKLNEYQVIEIFKSPQRYGILASIFGISKSQIVDIKRGRRWSHLTGKFYIPKNQLYTAPITAMI